MDKVVELVGGGSVINGAYPVLFLDATASLDHEIFLTDWLTPKLEMDKLMHTPKLPPPSSVLQSF